MLVDVTHPDNKLILDEIIEEQNQEILIELYIATYTFNGERYFLSTEGFKTDLTAPSVFSFEKLHHYIKVCDCHIRKDRIIIKEVPIIL